MRDSQLVQLDDWVIRISRPENEDGLAPVFFMLHGYKGNEDVMWIFADRLPKNALIFAPRAIHPVHSGGYNWVEERTGSLSAADKFQPAVEALDELSLRLAADFEGDWSRRHLLGFSQGAALCYTWFFTSPEQEGVTEMSAAVPAD